MKSGPKKAEMTPNAQKRYPSPKDKGGKLMREIIRALREQGFELPLTSHILCGISGGSDSTAMGVALAKYGRRIVPPEKIVFVHVNHGWRGEASDGDEAFVRALAKRFAVKFESRRLKTTPKSGESLEDLARADRKQAFREWSEKWGGAPVFTAHTADDVFETQIWRFFTGAWKTHGKGIHPLHGIEARPLLQVTRKLLQEFLQEESETWREDSTNQDRRFLRARIRHDLVPVLADLFPGARQSVLRNVVAEPSKQTIKNLISFKNSEPQKTRRVNSSKLR